MYDKFDILGLSITAENMGLTGLDPVWLAALIPIKTYSNGEADKDQILKENQNKSGIYMWRNLINNKKYIGSSENMHRRFREYFNINYLLKNNSMYICNALIKHGYCNFSLTILEYCSPEKCLIREKHYWDIFNPEYNIAQDPTCSYVWPYSFWWYQKNNFWCVKRWQKSNVW